MADDRNIGMSKKIQHSTPGYASGGFTSGGGSGLSPPRAEPTPTPTPVTPNLNEPVPIAQAEGPMTGRSKIRMIGDIKRHEDQWSRTPNATGQGAIHVRTFHAKLTDDALRYMDQAINEWLDAHPQYEVKFVNSTVGTLTGKLKEPHIICQVWV